MTWVSCSHGKVRNILRLTDIDDLTDIFRLDRILHGWDNALVLILIGHFMGPRLISTRFLIVNHVHHSAIHGYQGSIGST